MQPEVFASHPVPRIDLRQLSVLITTKFKRTWTPGMKPI